ncbi:MAG: radical SAM protein [Promethearchaeota archaeon]|nr:MAG: radical SAM protein [Candidatus Lokiarchaeota archaeon]
MSFHIIRPDSISAWQNKDILSRFSRYRGILDGTQIARYLIAKSVHVDFDEQFSTQDLEALCTEKSSVFRALLKLDQEVLQERKLHSQNYITLLEEISKRYLERCIFCERRCEVNRNEDEKGFCFLTKDSYVSSVFLHMGEESVLVPSGTIFFQGCNFGCVFCQNYDISQAWKGKKDIDIIAQKVDEKRLAELAEKLFNKGAMNINYVGGDPIPNIHTIIGSLNHQNSNVCQLWNSNFYCTEESLKLILDLMDFWLPDFKYGNNECAEEYSKVKNYYDVLTRNLKLIHDEGSGEIIIRHLVMPNHVECCSKPILDFILREVPKCVVNIMGQYRPEYLAYKYDEINRRPTSKELNEVKNYAANLGILYKPVS